MGPNPPSMVYIHKAEDEEYQKSRQSLALVHISDEVARTLSEHLSELLAGIKVEKASVKLDR